MPESYPDPDPGLFRWHRERTGATLSAPRPPPPLRL